MPRVAARLVAVLAAYLLAASWSWSQEVPRATPALVDLNNATQKELEALPGVGTVTAQRIIAARPITDLRQLRRIPGMSESRLQELIPLVTLGPPRPVGPPPRPAVAQPKARSTPSRGSRKPAAPAKSAPPVRGESDDGTIPGTQPDAPAKPDAAAPAKPDAAAKPAPASARESSARSTEGLERINLNRATLGQLESLPGIGPVKAQAILAGRPYRSAEEVQKVKGIGPATYAKIKDRITAP